MVHDIVAGCRVTAIEDSPRIVLEVSIRIDANQKGAFIKQHFFYLHICFVLVIIENHIATSDLKTL